MNTAGCVMKPELVIYSTRCGLNMQTFTECHEGVSDKNVEGAH